MSYIADKVLNLSKQLMPNGRAWWVPVGGFFEKFLLSFNGSTDPDGKGTSTKFIYDCKGILDSMHPDNAGFTDGTGTASDNDSNDWERRLGLKQWGITSGTTPT